MGGLPLLPSSHACGPYICNGVLMPTMAVERPSLGTVPAANDESPTISQADDSACVCIVQLSAASCLEGGVVPAPASPQ
eukprot:14528742-Alexandrium_andersonii.AAC.1